MNQTTRCTTSDLPNNIKKTERSYFSPKKVPDHSKLIDPLKAEDGKYESDGLCPHASAASTPGKEKKDVVTEIYKKHTDT